MDLVPRNTSLHSLWRALLMWQGFGKASFSKLTLLKFWSQGESCNFLWRGKINFRPIILLFNVPQSRARMFRDAGSVAGTSSPNVSFCSHQLASSAGPSRERLGNPNTPGAYQPCTSLPSTWPSRSPKQRTTSFPENQFQPRSAGFKAVSRTPAGPGLVAALFSSVKPGFLLSAVWVYLLLPPCL